eukprot:jgi/Galph1/4989/GphlegSOOS_G3622.1
MKFGNLNSVMNFSSVFCVSKLLGGTSKSLTLLFLNGEGISKFLVTTLWKSTARVVCADGGSNRLYDSLDAEEREQFVPHMIKGDLDSIRPDVLNYYSNKGVAIVRESNQFLNDFEKSLESLGSLLSGLPVVVLGGMGGRVDQQLANIHILYKFLPSKIYLLSLDQVMWLIPRGKHSVICSKDIEGPICGLLPVGSVCRQASTTGLRWNLKRQPLSFGTFVSSSNEIVDSVVEIETSDPLLWCCQLRLRELISQK